MKVERPNSTLKVDTDKPLRRRKPLERKTRPRTARAPSASGERDWSDAVWKRDMQGVCRSCGSDWRRFPGRRLECAHTAAREYDKPKPCVLCRGAGELPEDVILEDIFEGHQRACPLCDGHGSLTPGVLWINPDDIVPLCGPATDSATCHGRDHEHRLDLLPLLTLPEQLRVVQHLGSIENARVRLCPSEYPVKSGRVA